MKIFLLDFDGVVTDTLPVSLGVHNSLLSKHGVQKQLTPKEFTDIFLGNYHEGLAKLIPDDEIRAKITEERVAEFICRKDNYRVFDGIKEALSKLAENGKIIIISSNGTNFIETLLKDRNIICIDKIIGGDVEKSKVKKINWQKEKYPNDELYYIGDTTGDIREGKIAGVKTVGVTWGFHSRDVLGAENPDYLFDEPSELTSLT